MPGRLNPLVTDQYYHVFNRGINRQLTFTKKLEYKRAKNSLKFYIHDTTPVSFSRYLLMNLEDQTRVENQLTNLPRLVKLLGFCFMPNHFHLLVKQLADKGISKLLSNFQNSYTRYFNIKYQKTGALFDDQFKAVRVESDEQLMHLSRYIHLNPYTSYITKTIDELENYPWSSLSEFLEDILELCEPEEILCMFSSRKQYRDFIRDQADYQRELNKIKHLTVDL